MERWVYARAVSIITGALLFTAARPVFAQGWTFSLFVDPFPSPYASDWETNPNISSLTIVNPGATSQDVRIAYQIANTRGQILASGGSDPLGIPPGAPTVLTSILDIEGSSRRDQALWDQMQRTGRIPEGTYTACVTMASASRLVLGEDCATFTIVYPDAPQLIAPAPGEAITTQAPFFQWTPVVVPPAYPVQYVLQVAEVLTNQTAEEALSASVTHYQQPDLEVTNVQYPPNGQPFEPGKRYAWRVVAMDETGFPPTANGGLSEIRTFIFDDGSGTNVGIRTEIALTLANDFDDDSTGTDDAAGMGAGLSVDVAHLCAMWDKNIKSVWISSGSPLGLRRFKDQPAVLFRDTTAERWWIATKNPKGNRSVLVGGDCKRKFPTPVLWIASRDSAFQSEVTTRMANRSVGPDSMFSFIVLSRASDKVEAPAGFPEAEAFLGGRSLDVAMGLNTYMLLSLREWGMWSWFQSLGFKDRELEVTGFIGWDASWSIGGAVGANAGVDISTERKFLVLRAEFPKRTSVDTASSQGASPDPAKWWRSMGLAVEISVGDSTGRLFALDEHKKMKKDKSYSLDLVGKLIHTIEVNDELSLIGFIGLDLAREAKKGPAQDALARWDWLRGKRSEFAEWLTDKDRALKRVDAWLADKVKIQYMGGFEETTLNLDVVFGYGAEGRIASAGGADGKAFRIEALNLDGKFRPSEKKLTLVLSATAGAGDVEGAFKLGGSKAFYLEVPDTLRWLRDQKVLVREFRDAIADVAGPMPDCGGNRDHDHPMCQKGRALQSVNKNLSDARDTSWRIRLSAGHMPLGDVLQLIKGLFQ